MHAFGLVKPQLEADLTPLQAIGGPLPGCGRTHAMTPRTSLLRVVDKFHGANKVTSCTVFLASSL